MELRVLGAIELAGAGGAVRLPGQKHRRLLAVLAAVGPDAMVAVDVLVEALWPEMPPPSAAKLVQVYVSQLRKVLGEGVSIETRGNGYALMLDPQLLDAARFERLLGDAVGARREQNPELALSLVRRALSLWRGPAYGEFAYEDFARAEAERLEELRAVALEERFDAGLALGRHAEVLAELRAAAAEHPLRERLRAQTMLALYRCGRQAEALDLYADLRRRLRDELGLEPGPDLQALQRRILQHDPDLSLARAADPDRVVLPASPNALLGRERELVELHSLVTREDVRLLVLTGAGGSGKTRLALEVARQVEGAFANGAVFVELAPLRDPALVGHAIARALGLEPTPEVFEQIAVAVAGRELLLVLDNAEHLRDAIGEVAALLARARRLTVLVTSRIVLHLSGEYVYPVLPLAEDAAVALFEARARQAGARFDPRTDAAAIRLICERLDGLPLAIELAAARTPVLRLDELLARLEQRLPLLTGGPRDLPARQQTLRATIEWSYELLGPHEQALAAYLAVFVGGFTLEAAEAVCAAGLEELAALVAQSLLHRTTDDEFAYLETIREYLLERLPTLPDADDVRRRHFHHFLRLAESADLSAVHRRGGERLDVAAAARDNLRAALAWSLETGSVALGLELATAMERFWVTHNPREGMRWFEELLAQQAESVPEPLRAHALRAYGGAADIAGEDEKAQELYTGSLALFEQLRDSHGCAVLLHRLGVASLRRGELTAAQQLVEQSRQLHAGAGDRWGEAQTVATLGAIARDRGDGRRAFELIEAGLALAREVGVRWWEAGTLAELAALDLAAGRLDEAEARGQLSLALADELGDHAGRVLGVGLLAGIAAAREQHELAAQLWTAVAGEQAVAPLGGWRRHRAAVEARIAAAGAPDPSPALSLDAAVALALGTARAPA